MSSQSGANALWKVEDSPGSGTFTAIGKVTDYSSSDSQDENEVDVLNQSYPDRFKSRKEGTGSLTCLLDPDDTGQGALQTAYDNGSDIAVQYLPDGANGTEVDVSVTNIERSGNAAPDEPQEISFELKKRPETASDVSGA